MNLLTKKALFFLFIIFQFANAQETNSESIRKLKKEETKKLVLSAVKEYNDAIWRKAVARARKRASTPDAIKALDAILNKEENGIDPVNDLRLLVNNAKKFDNDKRLLKKGVYNDKMLNTFIANEISTFYSGGTDVSFTKFSGSYNTTKKTFDFLWNIDLRPLENRNKNLNTILSVGTEIKTNDEFGTLFKEGELQESNIALKGKFTWVIDGKINFKPKELNNRVIIDRNDMVLDYRENVLNPKYKTAAEKWAKTFTENTDSQKDSLNILYKEGFNNSKNREKNYYNIIDGIGQKEYNRLYSKIAADEIAFIKKNKLFRTVSANWLSIDLFTGLGKDEFITIPSSSDTTQTTNSFRTLNFNVAWSYLLKWNDDSGILLSPKFSLGNTNNIAFESISSKPLQTISNPVENVEIIEASKDVYITDYMENLSHSLGFDFTGLIKGRGGFSASISKSFGEFERTNWKLGIPIVTYDDKGKPQLNFEIQWRETNGIHTVGIATSILFGKLID